MVVSRLRYEKTISATYLGVNKLLCEVPCLSNRVGTNKRFADHEDLVRVGELTKLGQRAHQSSVVVSSARSIDEDHIVEHLPLRSVGGVHNSVACNGRSIFAIALFKQVDSPDFLTTTELAEVADVNGTCPPPLPAHGAGSGEGSRRFC
jgi:hypothetical protein